MHLMPTLDQFAQQRREREQVPERRGAIRQDYCHVDDQSRGYGIGVTPT